MSGQRRPVSLVLDGPPAPAWQCCALAAMRASPHLEVVGVRLLKSRAHNPLRRLHARLERHLLGLRADPLAPGAAGEPAPADGSCGQSPALVWLSEQPLAPAGHREIFHLRHGGRDESAEEAFCRAVLGHASWLQSEVLLRRGGETVVVDRTVSGVRAFSVALTRDLALWKLAALVPRAVERAPGLDEPAPDPLDDGARAPGAVALVASSAAALARLLTTRLLFRRPWSVRVRERGPQPARGWSGDGTLVRWTPRHIYADPHLIEYGGAHHLFCEEIPQGAKRGVISHTTLPTDGSPADAPRPVLERPYHLSYPFVFTHEDEVLMIPETVASARVELYKALDFPHRWRREAILLEDIDARDATLLAHGARLWLFVGIAAFAASSSDELHLYWADAPRGPWHPHPLNPVVSDARGGRPAGAVQRWGSRLVRPAQDGSRRYGWAISFREIDVLSPVEYAEHEVARLEPDQVEEARATHTYSADQRFEAIDLRRREWRGLPRGRRLARQRARHRGRGDGGA